MALRFNKRVKIAPGVTLNIGKTGMSASVGVKGAKTTVGAKGKHHTTVGIPGTGVSFTHVHKRARTDYPDLQPEGRSVALYAVAAVVVLALVSWLAW